LLRFGYPKVPGDAVWSVLDVVGPASYVQVVPGSPPTGGQLITAADFGMQALDFVAAMAPNTATPAAIVSVIPVIPPLPPGVVIFTPDMFNAEMTSVILEWWVSSPVFGQAATNAALNTEIVRLYAIGR
jgi:hypothetical protein